jgi:dihydroxy-acid dehydratase
MHLDELAVAAGDEARKLRVLPLLFHTISVSEGSRWAPTDARVAPSRDWIADSVELVVHAERMDGLFTIAGCDKTLPGMMMAMIRLDHARRCSPTAARSAGLLPRAATSRSRTSTRRSAPLDGEDHLEELTELELRRPARARARARACTRRNTMASVSRRSA